MTGDKLSLKVEKRQLLGRKVKKLRRQGLIPAVVYGKGMESVAIQFGASGLNTIKQAGETHLIYLQLGQKKLPTVVRGLQRHPVTGQVLHVDFYKVDLKEKISAHVPIELVGEAPVVKTGHNLVQVLHEIEVVALPADMPDKIQVDVSVLTEPGQDIRVKDLKLASQKIELGEVDPEETIVVVEKPKEEAEAPEEAQEEAGADESETQPEGGQTKPEAKPEKSDKEETSGSESAS